MTQPAPAADSPAPESFFGVVLRRSRYALAIACSAFIFSSLAWKLAAPPADFGGVSLTIWSTTHGIIAGVLLPQYLRGELFSAYQLLRERFSPAVQRTASGLFLVRVDY